MILLFFLAGCKKKEEKDSEKKIMSVEVAQPMIDSIVLKESYPGNLMAHQQVDIMARVDGIIKKVHVPSGSKVMKGQLLYSIEDTKYRDAVIQAKANIKTAESSKAYYTRQVEAMQKAYKDKAVSEIELLQAESNLEQSISQIENYKAVLKNAETMLGYCEVRAPFDGTISLQNYDEGAYINGETTPIKINTIYNDDILYAYISIPESLFIKVQKSSSKKGLKLDSVAVNFTEPLEHKYYSKINYEAPEVNPSTGTVTLRFDLNNKYKELKSGMYVNIELPYGIASNALLIKDASIMTDEHGKYVFTVNDSNKVVYTPISVGEVYQDTLRILESGLTPDSHYIVDALLKVKNGEIVKPFERWKEKSETK